LVVQFTKPEYELTNIYWELKAEKSSLVDDNEAKLQWLKFTLQRREAVS